MNWFKIIRNIAVSVFFTIIVYGFYNLEFIRANIEDKAFDLVNEFYFASKSENLNAPNLLLFNFDDKTLEEMNLLKDGHLSYGYLFPRNYIADFINHFDKYLEKEIKDKSYFPKAMFIDFDMSYSSDLHNKKLTSDDKYLIETLKKPRAYTIYLPKTSTLNFIEKSNDEIIKQKIKDKKIVFSSVNLKVSADDISRRYEPYKKFENKIYDLVDLELFNLYKKHDVNIEEEYKKAKLSFSETRIIFKDYKNESQVDKSIYKESFWENYQSYSANYDLNKIANPLFQDSIIFLGGNHSLNDDEFSKDMLDRKISGIEMHANALMTLFYLDGKLDRVNIFLSIFIMALVVVLCEFLVYRYSQVDNNKWWKYFDEDKIYLVLIFTILITISIICLVLFKQWFNWLIPSLSMALIPYLETIEEKIKTWRKR